MTDYLEKSACELSMRFTVPPLSNHRDEVRHYLVFKDRTRTGVNRPFSQKALELSTERAVAEASALVAKTPCASLPNLHYQLCGLAHLLLVGSPAISLG